MRNPNGTFGRGNPGGPGRPRRSIEHEYLDATIAAVPIDAWGAIVAKAVEQAKAGDDKARTWLSRIMGIDASKVMLSDAWGETLADDAPMDAAELAETQEQENERLLAALEILRGLGLANERMLVGTSAADDTEIDDG